MSNSAHYFVTRDSKGKYRIAQVDHYWNNEKQCFIIKRTTGIVNGKLTQQPDIEIYKGKANRTLSEQCILQRNAIEKKYCDKGYKELPGDITEYSKESLDKILPEFTTGSNEIFKPMLAKQADSIANRKVFDKEYYASRKINGLRILIYKGEDGELHTSSRGSQDYDAAMYEIITHPTLKQIFDEYPGLILDGEGYKHGATLNEINSVARTQVVATDYEFLQFYWYDIADPNKTFEERWELMNEIENKYHFGFDPFRKYNDGDLRIQFVPQEKITSWDNMIKLHDQYVSEGWEGLVIRLVNATYGPNRRTNDMIKIKQYETSTFKVVGIEQGLRMYDDMCFVLEMDDGKTFKAKPMGDHNMKVDYTDNFESTYLGHLGDCKYFNESAHGVVEQPTFLHFRFDLE